MRRFGKFEFDPVTRRVRREGEEIHLTPKAFELLAALLDASPRVVSKRELHARLWPGGVVADATLVALVKQLRAALDDRDRAAPLIRTVHRVGYALDLPSTRRERAVPFVAASWLTLGQRRMPLATGENIVGRDEAASIRLDDPMVSRRHARIVVSAAGAVIEDLGSKNGTFIDGRPIAAGPTPLRDGIRLAFGTVLAIYGESGNGMPTLTHAGPVDR
ncbi:MAG TPA: FHA domain-containing protein [Steroidobacteraceae bacterium]|nr:FHA domain-containing protein [Steroidobacteraceae bacterium]